MANLTISSQICIRIVLAFLQFLACVQEASKEEKERIKSVANNLKEIFRIHPEMVEDNDQKIRRPGILVSLFSTPQDDTEDFEDSDDDEPSSSTTSTARKPSSSKGPAMAIGRSMVNFSKEFKQAVLKYGGLESLVGDSSNPKKRINSIIGRIFNEALGVIRKEGPFRFNMKDIAEALKTLGNKAMETDCYTKAAEFYSCAIAITLDNAVYYCNRGAALMKIGRFHEAVSDCCKAISLNSGYMKAYYRLGLAYSEQGKYFDAIIEGFLRVLQIDPRNKPALTQLEIAEEKLSNQLAWLDRQLEDLRKKGLITRCRKVEIKEGSALVYQGKAEDGESDKFVLVDDIDYDPSEIEETMSVAEFIDLFSGANIAP